MVVVSSNFTLLTEVFTEGTIVVRRRMWLLPIIGGVLTGPTTEGRSSTVVGRWSNWQRVEAAASDGKRVLAASEW